MSSDDTCCNGFVWGSRSECGRCSSSLNGNNRHEMKIYGPDGHDERLGYYCEECANKIAEGK